MMKKSFLLLFLLGCRQDNAADGARTRALLLIMDGARVEECTSDWESDLTGKTGEEHADQLWKHLAPDAAVVRSITNTVLTSTAPSHASLVTGRAEPLFTVSFQNFDPAFYRPQLPTLFEELREQEGTGPDDAIMVANSVVMPNASGSIYPYLSDTPATWDMVVDNGGTLVMDDGPVVSRVEEYIDDGPPTLLVANLHNADRYGHENLDYAARVAEQSNHIADLWQWLQRKHPEYVENLLLIVTADHGRHRHELDGGWNNHGDSCTGCRQLPLFVAGGPVQGGQVLSGDYAQIDIAPTLAAHLGVDLPYAEGLPMTGLADVDGPARAGDVALSGSAGRLASQRWLSELSHRSEIQVDGEVVSDPSAWAAEAPTLLVGADHTYVCFRELSLEPEDGYIPWRPRCLQETTSGWTDIGFPVEYVGPFWRAQLHEEDGKLYVGYLHTPLTRDQIGGTDSIYMTTWDGNSWTEPDGSGVQFTTVDVEMAALGDGAFGLVAATNLSEPEQPYTRRTGYWQFAVGELSVTPTRVLEFQLEELLSEPRRVEHPVIRSDGDTVQIAMLGMDETQRVVALIESTDGGATWGTPRILPGEGDPLPHITPRWDGAALVWASLLDRETAALCRLDAAATAPICTPVGSARIDSFVVEDGNALASVDQGVGQWEIIEVGW